MQWATDLIDCASKSGALTRFFGGRSQQPPATLAMSGSVALSEGDSRRHSRSSVSLAAELHYNSESVSVTIGNLSRGGAMLKMPLSLAPSAGVYLARGALISEAAVVWSSNGRCGLEFLEEIEVGEWILSAGNVGQRGIDQIVSLLKTGQAAPEVTLSRRRPLPDQCANPQLSDDLVTVIDLLTDLKDDLTGSPDTLRRHPDVTHHLDAAIQMLSSKELPRCSRPQLLEGLGAAFELLRIIEDEIISCEETLARHGYKLQHLDLAMQLLGEIVAGFIIGEPCQPSGSSRLPRLRAACEHALSPK